MKVLIVYESIEGQTRKIAEFVAERMRASGHSVEDFNTQDRMGKVSFDHIDRIVLAAPVHERRHPESFEVFVSASRDALNERPTLLISVSLNAAFAECQEEAQDYLTEMKMRTNFEPTVEVLTAGAVRPGSYDYFESQVVRNVLLADRKVELINGSHEFTDWDALGVAVDAFVRIP